MKIRQFFREWLCRPTINAKHDSIEFSPPITVGERNQGKITQAYCLKCGKDLGQR